MIPLKIQLKNFLSYGSATQTIDLEPYHLICLSGKNGHGKSALLDSITWVLWGMARKVAGGSVKADEGLMRLGANHMMVVLDFICNKQHYRVRREYGINGGKATTQLDFGIIDTPSSSLRPLTDKTIRATQEKINHVIGLDYDSFVNSAFLRQGQSNEFSKKSPRERKEILVAILGLDRYETLRKKAAEHARLHNQEHAILLKTLERLEIELNQKATVELQLQDLHAHLNMLQQQEAVIAQEQLKLLDIKKQRDSIVQEQTALAALLSHTEAQKKELISTFSTYVVEWRAIHRKHKALHGTIQIQDTQDNLEQKLIHLEAAATEFRETQEHLIRLQHSAHEQAQKTVETFTLRAEQTTRIKTETQTTLHHIATQLAQITKRREALALEQKNITIQQEHLTADLVQLRKAEHTIDQQEKIFERRKSFYHHYVTRGNFLQQQLQELDEKKRLMHQAQAICQLCEQHLSVAHHEKLLNKLNVQEHQLRYFIGKIARILKILKEVLTQQHEHITKIKKQRSDAAIVDTRLQEIIKQATLCQKAVHELMLQQDSLTAQQTSLAKLLNELIAQEMTNNKQQALDTDPEYQTLISATRVAEQKYALLAPKELEYRTLIKQQSALAAAQKSSHDIHKEQILQQQRRTEIHALAQKIRSLHKTVQEIMLTQYNLDKKIEALAPHLERESIIAEETHQLASTKLSLSQSRGALEHHLKLLYNQEKEKADIAKKIDEADKENKEYQALADALGKDGLQALLIEEVVPEIEYEANELLAKLTDNQAQLSIESLRDLKNGGTKETLDIKISDALGIRPYEMFSGGEAFRIDFALRIALSKLLARRSGASLQTLIIDEGFGSQDEEGLAHIMDALYKIQDHFAKIIIVSHLATMKDQFPVHFLVQKTPQGSSINIIQHG